MAVDIKTKELNAIRTFLRPIICITLPPINEPMADARTALELIRVTYKVFWD